MNLRTSILAAVALVVFAWEAEAQARSARPAKAPVVVYGSVERTKLLSQGSARRGDGTAVLGSIERRAKLTGTTVRFPRRLSDTNGSLRTGYRGRR